MIYLRENAKVGGLPVLACAAGILVVVCLMIAVCTNTPPAESPSAPGGSHMRKAYTWIRYSSVIPFIGGGSHTRKAHTWKSRTQLNIHATLREVDGVRMWGYHVLGGGAGSEVGEVCYESVLDTFSEGMGAVKLNGKWGYMDATGALVIPPQFERAWFFSEGRASVQLNGRYGFIDKAGKLVVTPEYESVQEFSGGLAGVKLEGQWGFVDKDGNVIIAPKFVAVGYFSEGLAWVNVTSERLDSVGFIDSTGTLVISPEFNDSKYFAEGLAPCVWVTAGSGT